MGSNGSKPAATRDMRYMEIYSHGSTIYCSKWYKLYGFQGKLEKTAVRELSDKLRAATAGTTQGKKRKKLEAQLRVAALWAEQAHKRTGGAEEGMIAAAVSVKADEETGRSGSVDAVRREKERAIVEEHKAQEQRIKRKQEKERKDRVKGDFTGSWPNGNPLEPGQQDLINALAPVNISIERVFALRRDFTKVSGCRQGEKESVQDFRIRMEDCFRIHSGIPPNNAVDSPYVQQLKQSLMNGFHPGIADFIRKHNVNHRTCDLQECLNYAEHAATQIKEKRHKKASASAFFIGEDGEENQIFFVGPGQGRGGFNRGRGNCRGTGRGRGGGRNAEGKFLCFRCGKEGHMARDCEEQRPQNKEGGQKGQYKDERHGPPPFT
ncbi:uncharacterized protein LOC117539800 [Gymnodraco acuticeps]|uniref:Uncharacterized protein LOC117539800 n=1 Tax=Gymnodraco acuticeps TaxID=8218 RepID=A0A6P8TDQ0_GYMAC|nr:uncharacterized protein LOC117539800 [Gymnodraco acuticeps]